MLKVSSSVHNSGNHDGDDGDDQDRVHNLLREGESLSLSLSLSLSTTCWERESLRKTRETKLPLWELSWTQGMIVKKVFHYFELLLLLNCISSPTFECRRKLLLERRFFLPPPQKYFFFGDFYYIDVYLAQLLSTRGGCYLRGGGRVLVIGRWVSPRVPPATSADDGDDGDGEYTPGSLPQLLQMNGDRDDEEQCELCGWSVFVFVDHLSFFKISTSNSMLDMVGPLQVIRGRCAFICMGNVQPMYLQEEEVKTFFCNPSKTK